MRTMKLLLFALTWYPLEGSNLVSEETMVAKLKYEKKPQPDEEELGG